MNHVVINRIIQVAVIIYLAVTLYGCANKSSGPQGGPKDENPPKVKKESPLNGSLNYQAKEVEVEFDEIIVLESVLTNLLVSPPQKTPPAINAYGKKLRVKFEEDLVDSTTYTISFGDAIVDNNEKNVLKGYSFSFATGDVLDTMQVAGTMLNAEDLNPISGKVVGIYAESDDSVFTQKPFLRIARTDENGEFVVKNVKPGKYRVYGLNDINRDYTLQPGEGLAINDSIIEPYTRIEEMSDTIWADSVTVDSVHTYMGTQYYPNDVLLRYYEENRKRQYYMKSERKEPHAFSLFFATEAKQLPVLHPLTSGWSDSTVLRQTNRTNDTITYWMRDTAIIGTDTLRFVMDYMKTDSLFELQLQSDTISVVYRAPRIAKNNKKKDKENEKEPMQFLKFKHNASGTFEIYNPVRLQMESPIETYDTAHFHLIEYVDTIEVVRPYTFEANDSINMHFSLSYPWEAEKKYKLTIDSAAMCDIYGAHNDAFSTDFTIRSLEEYSKVIVKLSNYDDRAIIQMMDDKDKVVRELPAAESGAVFEHLSPKDYYMRLFIDENADGKWTTGEYAKKRQPEPVYYFPNKLTLRANWDFEENWDFLEKSLLEQKPTEIKKDAAKKD